MPINGPTSDRIRVYDVSGGEREMTGEYGEMSWVAVVTSINGVDVIGGIIDYDKGNWKNVPEEVDDLLPDLDSVISMTLLTYDQDVSSFIRQEGSWVKVFDSNVCC